MHYKHIPLEAKQGVIVTIPKSGEKASKPQGKLYRPQANLKKVPRNRVSFQHRGD